MYLGRSLAGDTKRGKKRAELCSKSCCIPKLCTLHSDRKVKRKRRGTGWGRRRPAARRAGPFCCSSLPMHLHLSMRMTCFASKSVNKRKPYERSAHTHAGSAYSITDGQCASSQRWHRTAGKPRPLGRLQASAPVERPGRDHRLALCPRVSPAGRERHIQQA